MPENFPSNQENQTPPLENPFDNLLQSFPPPDTKNREQFIIWRDEMRGKLIESEAGNYETKQSGIEGSGLFAKKDFQAGEVISHYLTGPYEYENVHASDEEDPALESFWQKAVQIGINAEGKGLYLTVPSGNPRGLLNHSCEPNAGLRRIQKQEGVRDTELVAIGPIKSGEELVIDYSTTQLEEWDMTGCNCGSSSCRHHVTEFTRLPENLQEKYINLGIVPKYIVEIVEQKNRDKVL